MRFWGARWSVSPELLHIISPHALYFDAFYPQNASNKWEHVFGVLLKQWIERYEHIELNEHPVFRAVGCMFHKSGVDPTKYRPSSEALIRRVLKEGTFPFIHPGVALNNIVSLYSFLPMGCYDPTSLGPSLSIRHGREGERFESLRHRSFRVEGRPVIADNGAFGGPIVDSVRTALHEESQAVLYVFFTPAEIPVSYVLTCMRWMVTLSKTYHIARFARFWLFDPERNASTAYYADEFISVVSRTPFESIDFDMPWFP